jgi:hypothetical protein
MVIVDLCIHPGRGMVARLERHLGLRHLAKHARVMQEERKVCTVDVRLSPLIALTPRRPPDNDRYVRTAPENPKKVMAFRSRA